MPISSELRALVVTLDSRLGASFREISREFGIDAQTSASAGGVSEELRHEKYEALLVDFDTIADTGPILSTLQESPANRTAIVMAVATGIERKEQALSLGANFVFARPLQLADVRVALNTAHGQMVRERRRYFRCPIELPVQLVRSNSEVVSCTTLNLSRNGMAVHSQVRFDLGESVDVAFSLQEGASMLAQGTVVWDDRHEKAGINFTCKNPEMQKMLDSWLGIRFARSLS